MSRRLAAALGPLLVLASLLVGPGAAAGPVWVPAPGRTDAGGVWPLDPAPEVVSGFDPPGQPWEAGHRGVDLAGSAGQSVRAALAGTVRYAGRIAGRGVVVVHHGDTRTTYEPVAATTGIGAQVAAGDQIGTLELAGGHCLPRACLHWGLRRGTTYLDPLALVGGGPVRLLPLWRADPADLVGPELVGRGSSVPALPPPPGVGDPSRTSAAPLRRRPWHDLGALARADPVSRPPAVVVLVTGRLVAALGATGETAVRRADAPAGRPP